MFHIELLGYRRVKACWDSHIVYGVLHLPLLDLEPAKSRKLLNKQTHEIDVKLLVWKALCGFSAMFSPLAETHFQSHPLQTLSYGQSDLQNQVLQIQVT